MSYDVGEVTERLGNELSSFWLGGPRFRPYTSRKISWVQPGIELGTSWMAERRPNHYTKQGVANVIIELIYCKFSQKLKYLYLKLKPLLILNIRCC